MSVPNSYLKHVNPRVSYIRRGPPWVHPINTVQGLLAGDLTEKLLALRIQRAQRKVPLLRPETHARDLCALLELTGFHKGLSRSFIGDFFGRDIKKTTDDDFVSKVCRDLRDKLEEGCGLTVRFDGTGLFRLLKDHEAMAILNLHLIRQAGDLEQLSQLSYKLPAPTVYALIQRPLFGDEYGHAAD